MKLLFFLIPLLLIGITPIYAQTEQGQNFDDTLIGFTNDDKEIHQWKSVPERILINDVWQDSRYTITDDFLILETGHGSVKLNKSTCSFDFYKKGIITDVPLFTDSIVAKMANNGTENFSEITQISNASCETYGSDYQLVAKKYVSGIGFLEYKYINTGSAWKTQLEATNLSTLTNQKFGFTQTIDLNRDTINYGGSEKNLDNYDNQSFDRNWLENNKSKVLDFLNDITFDFDLGFANLKSITVYDTGLNKSKLSFNYLYNSKVILPNNIVIIDPTYGYTTATAKTILTTATTAVSCGTGSTSNAQDFSLFLPRSDISDSCAGSVPRWNISSIPTGATATDVKIRHDVGSVTNMAAESCQWRAMQFDPNTASNADLWADLLNGTQFATDTQCRTVSNNYIVDLGSSGNADVTSKISAGYWSVGESLTSGTRTPLLNTQSEDVTGGGTTELQITYTTTKSPYAVTDLSTTSIGQTQLCYDWTEPNLGGGGQFLLGYQINLTTPYTNNPLVYTNNTGTATSSVCISGLTQNTPYSSRVSAWTNVTNSHPLNNATGNIINATTLDLIPPSAPTLSALSESETSVRFTSINGTTGDRNMFYYGLRCVENSSGSWITIVSNSTTPSPRIYSYTLTPGDSVTCQWRDGSFAGFGAWSNNATETTGQIGIIQTPRGDHDDKLMDFVTWITEEGGLYFGMGVFPMVIMLIGFMATKGTVRIFTLISLMAMGIIHASGYFEYPTWYWTLAILFGIVLVLGRQARD